MSFITQPANLTTVSGTLGPTNGGTGLTSPGASGNILTSNGTAWTSAAPASSSSFNLISTVASNGVDNFLLFTGLTGYNNYYLTFNSIPSIKLGFTPKIEVGTGSPVTWLTSGYFPLVANVPLPSTAFQIQNTTSIATGDSNSGYNASGSCSFFDMTNGKPFHMSGQTSQALNSTTGNLYFFQNINSNTAVKTGIRVSIGTGSVVAAGDTTASLYGISS
jgi:hypothetical protein